MHKRNYVLEDLDSRSGTTDAEIEERERLTIVEDENETTFTFSPSKYGVIQ